MELIAGEPDYIVEHVSMGGQPFDYILTIIVAWIQLPVYVRLHSSVLELPAAHRARTRCTAAWTWRHRRRCLCRGWPLCYSGCKKRLRGFSERSQPKQRKIPFEERRRQQSEFSSILRRVVLNAQSRLKSLYESSARMGATLFVRRLGECQRNRFLPTKALAPVDSRRSRRKNFKKQRKLSTRARRQVS